MAFRVRAESGGSWGVRRLAWLAGFGGILGGGVSLVVSPWLGAQIIRRVFAIDTRRLGRALEAHRPAGITVIEDQRYRPDDPDATFDVYVPVSTPVDVGLPTVVWIHGGAWLSGDKSNNVGYFALLASHGFTVVAVNYSLAPGATYPTAVLQVNDALAHLARDAQRFHVDPQRFVLAGDSAGAQIASQIACLATNPSYAESLGVPPALEAGQLRGVILYCGFYDMRTFIDQGDKASVGFLRWGVSTMVWAYSGHRAKDSPAIREMSTINHVTNLFPPTFLSGGNGDPLTIAQSHPMAERLRERGVPVVSLFYPPDHQPRLPHEYQFNLDCADGAKALTEMLAFLGRCTA